MTAVKRKIEDQNANADAETPEPELKKKLVGIPESAEQLLALLVPLDAARQLLESKLPLNKLRDLLNDCWIRYYGVRERKKDPSKDFFVDRVFHVNRDGLRFRNSKENSYRNIQKLKEPEIPFNKKCFEVWLDDMRIWNEPVPSLDQLKDQLDAINAALAEINSQKQNLEQIGENKGKDETNDAQQNNQKEAKNEVNGGEQQREEETVKITKADISKLVITIEDLAKLVDYGKDVFESVVTGFYAQIRAPPNPNLQPNPNKAHEKELIYMDQIIGVNWVGKPYMIFQKPMTMSLKFRHFRDEKLKALPYRDKKNEVDQKVFDQWLNDMKEWEEDLPTLEFIDGKISQLNETLTKKPDGPAIDLMTMVEGDKSQKQLRRIIDWQKEQESFQQIGRNPPPSPAPLRIASNSRQPPRHPPLTRLAAAPQQWQRREMSNNRRPMHPQPLRNTPPYPQRPPRLNRGWQSEQPPPLRRNQGWQPEPPPIRRNQQMWQSGSGMTPTRQSQGWQPEPVDSYFNAAGRYGQPMPAVRGWHPPPPSGLPPPPPIGRYGQQPFADNEYGASYFYGHYGEPPQRMPPSMGGLDVAIGGVGPPQPLSSRQRYPPQQNQYQGYRSPPF